MRCDLQLTYHFRTNLDLLFELKLLSTVEYSTPVITYLSIITKWIALAFEVYILIN
jgi:hypothetical protein